MSTDTPTGAEGYAEHLAHLARDAFNNPLAGGRVRGAAKAVVSAYATGAPRAGSGAFLDVAAAGAELAGAMAREALDALDVTAAMVDAVRVMDAVRAVMLCAGGHQFAASALRGAVGAVGDDENPF